MIKKLILILLFLSLIIPINIFANDEVSSLAKNWFSTFSNNIANKYSTPKEVEYFKGFSNKLDGLLATKKFTDIQIDLIMDLIKLSNEYVNNIELSNINLSNRLKLNSYTVVKNFKNISYNSEHIFLENGIWYTYRFNEHLKSTEGTIISKEDLIHNEISFDNDLVFLNENNSLGFVKNYEKIKLISDSIIFGIPDKFNFLKEIKNDKKNLNYETDELFRKLKNISHGLTDGKTKNEKIKIIYNYVLKNTEYKTDYSLIDYSASSGIDTFENGSGICEGYAKVFLYILNFSNINYTELIRGDILDAPDFPEIGHAWVKIGENYYDPTFDDPIGQIETKKFHQYKYFGLPFDLFYTNRYAFGELPISLESQTPDYLKNYVSKRIIALVQKYRYSNYNILKPYMLKLEYGISLDKELDIGDLKKMIKYYEVNDYKFVENGEQKDIKSMQYYTIGNMKISDIVKILEFSFDGYYLFKWELKDGSNEYRIAYDVKFH